MDGGDKIIDSVFYHYYPDGVTESQTTLILPKKDNTFYVFYDNETDSLYLDGIYAEPDLFQYAVVDMSQNQGRGKVLSKKNTVYKGLFGDCRLTACRHANGRDWWVVHQGYISDEYFIYLITPDSVYPPHIQHIGVSGFYDDNAASQAGFSPDGAKYFTATARSPVEIMNFDRCIGYFSNADTLGVHSTSLSYNGQSFGIPSGMPGCCFSPNGRFLYCTNSYEVWQFDTWAGNVNASAIMIGRWDSIGPANSFFGLNQMFLMPNGKIIIGNVALNTAFHLIDSPEVRGIGCHFRLNGFPVNTLNAGALPNMINYRLGRLAGSACDTLTGIQEVAHSGNVIRIQPNPAQDHVTISLSTYLPDEVLTITDATGHVVYYDSAMYLERDVPIGSWAGGVYIVTVHSGAGTLASRFVKE